MRNLSKLLVLVAVISAFGYVFHRVQTCKIAGVAAQTANPEPSMVVPASAAESNTELVYPTTAVNNALELGYQVFTKHSDSSMTALPLPPGTAFGTTLSLAAAGHQRLIVTMSNPKCSYAVDVSAFRADENQPILHAHLAAHGESGPQVFDLAKTIIKGPVLISIKLDDRARNNWFCNITLAWDDSQ